MSLSLANILSNVVWTPDTSSPATLWNADPSQRRTITAGDTFTREGVTNAAALLGNRLPGANEHLHAIMAKDFAMGDLAPALVRIAGKPCRWLGVLTLGWNAATVNTLCDLLQGGHAEKCDVICSQYFSGADKEAFEAGAAQLRTAGARVADLRSHCKVLLADFGDGATITAAGSGNFRSCRCLENLCVTGNPDVFRLYAEAIRTMIEHPDEYD